MDDLTLDPIVARAYRNARREGIPARIALAGARAAKRGRDLAADAEDTADGGREWTIDCGAGIRVVVQQVPDQEACDCWDWARDNPRDDGQPDDIPNHGHFGLVATALAYGREVAYEACWGYVWDWPGQDDDAELAYAWSAIADGAIEDARQMAASLPAWVVAQKEAWEVEA